MSVCSDSKGVPLLVEKALLQIIEKRNQSRDEVALKHICDSNKELFGRPGSDERREIQMFWKNCKSRTPGSYARHLQKLKITPSEATTRELQDQGRQPSLASAESDNEDKGEEQDESFDDDAPFFADDRTLPDMIPSTPPKLFNSASGSPALFSSQVPPQERATMMSTPSPPRQNWSSPSPLPSLAASSSAGSESSSSYEGSKDNPVVIYVDTNFPERNGKFDVEFIPRIEHGGWAREGYHIRVEIGIADADMWSAYMEDNHTIIIRGRSRSSTFDQVKAYHRKNLSPDTKAVHETTCKEMQGDPARQSKYWKLVFRCDEPLDNAILSGDDVQIMKKNNGIKYMVGQIECRAMFVHWDIAKKGRGHRINDLAALSLEDAFD
jgi:hypothetical protein